jgi:hypothetical protein
MRLNGARLRTSSDLAAAIADIRCRRLVDDRNSVGINGLGADGRLALARAAPQSRDTPRSGARGARGARGAFSRKLNSIQIRGSFGKYLTCSLPEDRHA